MKKYVVIERTGTWTKKPNGGKIIDCTVKAVRVVKQSDDYFTLIKRYPLNMPTQYHDTGVWTSYSVETRKWAKMSLR